jgi:hypothetical protein
MHIHIRTHNTDDQILFSRKQTRAFTLTYKIQKSDYTLPTAHAIAPSNHICARITAARTHTAHPRSVLTQPHRSLTTAHSLSQRSVAALSALTPLLSPGSKEFSRSVLVKGTGGIWKVVSCACGRIIVPF